MRINSVNYFCSILSKLSQILHVSLACMNLKNKVKKCIS